SLISYAPPMPQNACHAKSSTKLLKLNNRIVLAHIADSKRHDPDDSNIVQGFALDCFAIFGDEWPTYSLRKVNPRRNAETSIAIQSLSTKIIRNTIPHAKTARTEPNFQPFHSITHVDINNLRNRRRHY
ncbi:TPA: hypothetical protein ACXPLG_005932, partial [Klebsiella pneumoniae]